jgi:penicillin-binding protein 1C
MKSWSWIGLVGAACLGGALAQPMPQTHPTFDEFKAAYAPSDRILLDRHGQAIASKRVDNTARRLAWTALSDTSPAFLEALLVAEDKRFYEHSGVDWLGVIGAVWDNLGRQTGNEKNKAIAKATRGASSISMQVAALLDPQLARQKQGRDLGQKWDQMHAALSLEKTWSKAQILEAYLNTITYRGELQGLRAASYGLFQKAPSGLSKSESALLAALVRAPNAKAHVLIDRACAVLVSTQAISKSRCDRDALQAHLDAANLKPQAIANMAPHAAEKLLTSTNLSAITSTLDASLQRKAHAALQEQIASLHNQGAEDGAVVVLDNQSGEVLAYVGSSGAWSDAPLVDAASSPRQAGSTLKPFLYASAFDLKRLTAATVLEDSAVALPTDVGLYAPQNYDRQFMGPVSVRTALASSLNIPAVRTLALLPEGQFHRQLRQLGISTLVNTADHYGLSLALGSADVKLIELTNAYRTLANGGVFAPWRWQASAESQSGASQRGPAPRRVFSSEAAWLISNILSDNAARAHTFGFDSVLATPVWTAVKTGTSKDMRDNWCIGYSERYTVGVWVGNASGAAMRNVSGVSGAAPAWEVIMRLLHKTERSRAPNRPANIESQAIRFEADIEPGRTEWFLKETKPKSIDVSTPFEVQLATSESGQHTRILYPVNQSLMAWDPDIPAAMQGIPLKHSGAKERFDWYITGQKHDSTELLWARDRIKGKVQIELRDKQGLLIDAVGIELRGKL